MNILSYLSDLDNQAIRNVVGQKYPDAVPYSAPTAFITPEIMRKIIPGMTTVLAQQLADIFNELAPTYGLNSPKVFPEYVAQCAHESANFTKFTEGLMYSAQGLANTWPTRYSINPKATLKAPNALAVKLQRDPKAIANNCYANRMGNGNEASGDGWRFRGGGPIQMTGKDMYIAYGKYKGIEDLDFLANKIRTDLRWAIDSSMWVFVVQKKLLDEAEANKFDVITNAINGGQIGAKERKIIYARALAALPEN